MKKKKDTQYGEQFCSTQVESVQLGKTTDLTFKFLVSPRDRVKCGGLVWELELAGGVIILNTKESLHIKS